MLRPKRFSVTPFPLEDPGLWHGYVPLGTLHLVRVYSPWEADKVERLRQGGYRVTALSPDRDVRISATDIRKEMAAGGYWTHWVPAGVKEILLSMGSAELKRRCTEPDDHVAHAG